MAGKINASYRTKRQKLEILRMQLSNERSTFLTHWRQLGDFIMPRRPRFEITDVNRGDKRNQNIIDSTATMSVRTLRSGMMSGVTSPARPWFRLTTPDPGLAEYGPVKLWLNDTVNIMSTTFLRSNLYNILPICYGDMGVFGTAAVYVEEDFDRVMHFHSFPIGSYMIAKDAKGRVNTFVREFRMTVRQLVEMFGEQDKSGKYNWNNFSAYVQNQWELGYSEAWIDVIHTIRPNDEYNPHKPHSKYKKFESCYYERGSSGSNDVYLRDGDNDKYLRESGYDYFPVLCPRWETTAEDVYGTECPGMVALGDIRQLQTSERRIAQAIDKMVNPPMVGGMNLRTQKVSILPGDVVYEDAQGGKGFRPSHEVNVRLTEMEQKQEQVRHRIQRSFFEDLFLMLSQSDRRMITAREIDERHEEKLLALGPVLEQLNQDLLDPLIDIAFDLHLKQQWINGPKNPIPKELQGMPLKVEYISIMAQAQKLVGVSGVERFTGYVTQLAQLRPDVVDKLNADHLVDVYADMTSVPPSGVNADDAVQKVRDQRAQAQQQQAQMQQMQQGAMAARNLSQTDLGGGDNALKRMIEQTGAPSVPV